MNIGHFYRCLVCVYLRHCEHAKMIYGKHIMECAGDTIQKAAIQVCPELFNVEDY